MSEQEHPFMAKLREWQEVSEKLDDLKAREKDLRVELFSGAFMSPTEGTNKHKLPDGRVFVGKYTVNRYVEAATIDDTLNRLREMGVGNTDELIRYKPELAIREFRSLSDEAKLVLSESVTARPGTPQIEIRKR